MFRIAIVAYFDLLMWITVIIIVDLYIAVTFSIYKAWLMVHYLTLLDLSHELFFHLVKKTHDVVKIWLNLLLEVLCYALIGVIVAIRLSLRSFL